MVNFLFLKVKMSIMISFVTLRNTKFSALNLLELISYRSLSSLDQILMETRQLKVNR